MIENVAGYRIIKQSGGDNRSILYRAVDKNGNRVLLRYYQQPLPAEQYVPDLQWTTKAIAPLKHPDIVRIIEWGETQTESPYLAMEYIRGRTLAALLANAAKTNSLFEPVTTLQLVHRLTTALEAGLRRGIVHKDLQPDQIVVRPDGTPALLGLDLPETLAFSTGSDDTIRTRYLSPEQQQGKALDGRSNIYSLGMLLYTLLADVAPSPEDVSDLPALWELNSALSEMTYRLVHKSLQPEVWKRYQTYSELRDDLEGAILAEGGSVSALSRALVAPTTATTIQGATSQQLQQESKRSPLARPAFKPYWAFGLALLLVLFILGGLLSVGSNEQANGIEENNQALAPISPANVLPTADPLSFEATPESDPTSIPATGTSTTMPEGEASPEANASNVDAVDENNTPTATPTLAPSQTTAPSPTPTLAGTTVVPSATLESVTATATSAPSTPEPPTATPQPTDTPQPTATPPPPSPTSPPPTATSAPPTPEPATPTPPPPSPTPPLPTATPPQPTLLPPTLTPEPTATPAPPTPTAPSPIAALEPGSILLCQSPAASGCDRIGSSFRLSTFLMQKEA